MDWFVVFGRRCGAGKLFEMFCVLFKSEKETSGQERKPKWWGSCVVSPYKIHGQKDTLMAPTYEAGLDVCISQSAETNEGSGDVARGVEGALLPPPRPCCGRQVQAAATATR